MGYFVFDPTEEGQEQERLLRSKGRGVAREELPGFAVRHLARSSAWSRWIRHSVDSVAKLCPLRAVGKATVKAVVVKSVLVDPILVGR